MSIAMFFSFISFLSPREKRPKVKKRVGREVKEIKDKELLASPVGQDENIARLRISERKKKSTQQLFDSQNL